MTEPRHQVSAAALELIKGFEGYQGRAACLPDGRWTIGHGHSLTAREGARVSRDDAEALLIYDLGQVAVAIDQAVFTPLTQNQFDALASFVFNIGVESFRGSAVLRRINEGDLLKAAFAMELWRKADFEGERIVVDALVRRRAAEKALFLTPEGGWIPAPSPVIEPKADHGLADVAPFEAPLARSVDAEDSALSPIERAAANLAARFQALAPDEPSARPIEEVVEPPIEPAPFLDVQAPEPEPTPIAEPASVTLSRPASPAEPDIEAMRRTIFGLPEPRPKPRRGAYAPLTLLGAAGLCVFVGAMIWAFHVKPAGGTIAPLNIAVVGVGFIGILCVASAVYFLLEKLAGRDQ